MTKRVKWIVDGTTLADGTPLSNTIPGGGGPTGNYLPGIVVGNSPQSAEFSQNGSQGSDFAVVHSSYVVNHSAGSGGVIANNRTDTIIYNSPANYVWGGVDRLLWCGTQTPNGFGAAEHVGRYVQTIRQSITNGSNGRPLPQPNLWAACLEYRDTTGQPSSSAASSITVEMDLVRQWARRRLKAPDPVPRNRSEHHVRSPRRSLDDIGRMAGRRQQRPRLYRLQYQRAFFNVSS